jgi:undecaprenyl-phosphate 4-deoxy-4-formamido-L-arabinose transferase
MKISVVIPVYRSEEILPVLMARLNAVLPQLSPEYEVILVNDGSPDRSWEVICEQAKTYAWLRGINLMCNYGQHNALLAGIHAAQYEVIVTMDDDLQHPPEEIPKLLEELQKGCDVVYGVPAAEMHGFLRDVFSRFMKWLMGAALGIPHIPRIGAFRAFRSLLREAFRDYRSQFVSIDVLLSWGTNRFSFVTVRHEPRYAGQSNYNFRKLVRHTFNMITGFSILPLRLASLMGFAFTIFGFFVLLYVLVRFFVEGSPVQGFPFLASIVAIFSGVQLFALGIFGEYLARMYFRLMGRPPSVTRETVGWPTSAKQSDD